MSWQILIGLSILLYSVNSIFHRVLMKDVDSDPSTQAFVFTNLVGVLGLLIAVFQG